MADEKDHQPPSDFIGLPEVSEDNDDAREMSALTKNIARLEISLDSEKEERLEERFNWVCCLAILMAVIFIVAIDGSWLFVPVFMLELVMLIGFAKKCGVDWAVRLLGELLNRVSTLGKK